MADQPQRWTEATVNDDMWADPHRDPRDIDLPSPDGEAATLQGSLNELRMTLLMKCEGLDTEQLARRSVPPSTMSLLGLLRHLVEVERSWRSWITPEQPVATLYGDDDAAFDDAVASAEVVESAYADLAREQVATDALLAQFPDHGARFVPDGTTVRGLMAQRIEEYARHCGHADLLRECIDGRVGQ